MLQDKSPKWEALYWDQVWDCVQGPQKLNMYCLIKVDKGDLQHNSWLCWYWQLQQSGNSCGRLGRLLRAAWDRRPSLFPTLLPREPFHVPWPPHMAKGFLSCLSLFLSVRVYGTRGMMFWKDLKASQNESERNHWSSQQAPARGKGDTEVHSSLSMNFRAGWIKPI